MTVVAPRLPPGQAVEIPGRGTTFVRRIDGPAGAPTVVLLHGWMATADLNWFPTYAPLGEHFGVVALDHRGHGRGIRTRRPFRLEDCADDVAALALVLGLRSVIAVGYSMGGPIAQLLWRRHRDLVSGLVLCATARNFGRTATDRALFASMLGLSAAARFAPASVRRQAFDLVIGPRVSGRPLAEWAAGELRRNDPAAVLQAGWSIGTFSSHSWIGEVDVPTAVVVTLHDQVVSPRRQYRLAESIAGAEVVTVAGGHDACITGAERFVPALVSACRQVSRRAQSTARP